MLGSNILLIMTGSIACYKCGHLISKLSQEGHSVQVVATRNALNFIGETTLEGLSGRPVKKDLYQNENVMDHIHLMRWADVIIVAPASANFINKIAQGLGDDLASTLILAHDYMKPFIIAPAMNTMMYQNPITQNSIEKLKKMGVQVLETETGSLACGEVGEGRLLNPDKIFSIVKMNLKKPKTHQKILVTAGGTRIDIDDVRYIGNVSTGQTGVDLSDQLVQLGYDVTLLRSIASPAPQFVQKNLFFKNFKDLDSRIKEELSLESYTHIIHLAAVSDFDVDKIFVNGESWSGSKLPSGEDLTLKMKSTYKIIDKLREYSRNKNVKIVAFKLTSGGTKELINEKIEDLFDHSKADWIVHNDLSEISSDRQTHYFTIYKKGLSGNGEKIGHSKNVFELSENIKKLVLDHEHSKPAAEIGDNS